jgi:hypothetical protein
MMPCHDRRDAWCEIVLSPRSWPADLAGPGGRMASVESVDESQARETAFGALDR